MSGLNNQIQTTAYDGLNGSIGQTTEREGDSVAMAIEPDNAS